MKKECFFVSATALVLAAGVLGGCTPKATLLWCYGLGGTSQFEIQYAVLNNTYDGAARTFSVKDEEKFTSYLQTAENYVKKVGWSDGDGEAYLFVQNGKAFYCGAKNGARYTLAPSALTLVGEDDETAIFVYPPTIDNYVFYAENETFAVTQDWSYFSDFYKNLTDTEVDAQNKTVTASYYRDLLSPATGTVVLTYSEGYFAFELFGADNE